jgi:hypothetical protein
MLDIETLSTRPDACVTAFGLVAFNEEGITASTKCVIKSSDWHGHIDPGTVAWWLGQSEEARKTMTSGVCTAAAAAETLGGFLVDYCDGELWANDPDFDVVITRSWWQRMRTDAFPVSYKASRSCRTIYAEARRRNVDLQSAWHDLMAHDPLSDAVCQARAVILARRSF